MSQTLRKRERETEALPDSIDAKEPKRLHGKETEQFLYLLQVDKTLASDEEDEECPPSEELLTRLMRSLEEEIAATCSISNLSSGDYSSASDIARSYDGQNLDSDAKFDLSRLLEASDNDLGIPPSPILDFKVEDCVSTKETSELSCENQDLKSPGEKWHFEANFENSPDLKSPGEKWHFEANFENSPQLALYEDFWDANQLQDYMNRDFVSEEMFFDCDFSSPWTSETAVKGFCNTV